MIIGTITLITILLFGAAESPFVIPDAADVIVDNIDDKARKKDAKEIFKSYEDAFKEVQKFEKKKRKEFSKLVANREIGKEGLESFLKESNTLRKDYNNSLITGRLQIQDFLTDEEWDEAMKELSEKKPKKVEKEEKAKLKEQLSSSKLFIEMNTDIKLAVTDKKGYEKCKNALDRYENRTLDVLIIEQERAAAMIDILERKDATQMQLEKVTLDYEMFREEVQDAFLDLREELRAVSTEQNWPKLVKALEKSVNG